MVDLCLKLPEHYLEEEVRDGYTISSEMKKIWAVELDLLNEFMRVCKKHDIKFFAAGGTLLGAVRHKGFIPWDDDVDLMMFRSEYNRLCEIGPQEFQHPYFFQTEETDPGSYRGHAQLRNSETTGILKYEYHQKKKINQGIFIDIFPLDYVPDDIYDRKDTLSRIRWYSKKYHDELTYTLPYNYNRKNIFASFCHFCKALFKPKREAVKKADDCFHLMESVVLKHPCTNTLLLFPISQERFVYEKQDLASSVDCPFEMFSIPLPVNYEAVLNKTYGEWNVYVRGGSIHGGVLFDTNKCYKEYLK